MKQLEYEVGFVELDPCIKNGGVPGIEPRPHYFLVKGNRHTATLHIGQTNSPEELNQRFNVGKYKTVAQGKLMLNGLDLVVYSEGENVLPLQATPEIFTLLRSEFDEASIPVRRMKTDLCGKSNRYWKNKF